MVFGTLLGGAVCGVMGYFLGMAVAYDKIYGYAEEDDYDYEAVYGHSETRRSPKH